MISTVFLGLAAALYLAATMRYQKSLYAEHESSSDTWTRGRGFMFAAFLAQTGALISEAVVAGGIPIFTLPQTLALMSWVMVGMYLVMGRRWKMEVLGAFAAPAATLMMMVTLATLHMGGAMGESSDWMPLHVGCIVLGYASFLLATMVAALYFFQTFLLKNKNVTGVFQKMPSLENLDRVTYRLIAVGFIPMIVGIALGFVRAEMHGVRFWSFDVLLGLLTVGVYALYMNARLIGGWQGRKVNGLLLVGFLFLVATYVGAVLPWSVHQR